MSSSLINILKKLNLFEQEGLYFFNDLDSSSNLKLSVRIKESLSNKIKPDAFFCLNNEPLILFFDNPSNIEAIHKKCWNFNQAPVIFIIQPSEISIYNGFNYLKEENELSLLSDNVDDFDYFKIITGEAWGKFKVKLENKNRVDTVLLKSIEDARNKLIDEYSLPIKTANYLIGRIIFLRYLIDRKVELNKYGILSKEDFYKILASKQKAYLLFKRIKEDFNGNLFPVSYLIDGKNIDEEDIVDSNHLSVIIDLLKGTDIGKEQPSLFEIFDFKILPIEFISNVYEKFIGKKEQAENGAYYTPLFLVDYIQKETVSNYFEANPNEFNCKVLDPACGSGIFLVETYRQIITQYQKNNPSYKKNITKYKESLKSLLVDNIFGIDKDESAISVAIFSLYITLLDYLDPSSIVDFQFPPLINTNFFAEDFFDTNANFNSIINNLKLQFILGNPPWCTKWSKEKQVFENYIESRNKLEKSKLEIENREIAEAFLIRASDFNVQDCALIVTSKILYKISRKKNKKGVFRNYFLSNFKLNQVFELSSVRHQVFDKSNDKAVAPTTILFYSKSNNLEKNKENVIKHISLKPNIFFETFKLLVVEKYDYKEIQQKYFIENDWAWKVFVYGNILDYQFIERFKKTKSIFESISDKGRFIFGKGISVGGGDKNNIEKHKKVQNSINSKGKGLKPYYIDYDTNFLKKLDYVHRPRNINLFKAPVLLVGKGISKDFKAKSALSYKDVIYTDAITGIKALNEKDTYILETLLALFNSDLFSYFLILTNSSIGIEREQAHDKDDKFSVPFVYNKSTLISTKLKELTKWVYKEINLDFETTERQQLRKTILQLQKELNAELLELYQISDIEKALLNYTKSITLPLLKGSEIEKSKILGKVKFDDKYLTQYVKIFVDHFGKRFNSNGKYFEAEILISNHTILIKFKVVKQPSKNKDYISWNETSDTSALNIISKLSFEQHSSNLFIQKDIKGFEKDFFYVAKPNQYKSWHPAIAYLDLAEFIEALHNDKPKSITNG